jgi:hypothetical protein
VNFRWFARVSWPKYAYETHIRTIREYKCEENKLKKKRKFTFPVVSTAYYQPDNVQWVDLTNPRFIESIYNNKKIACLVKKRELQVWHRRTSCTRILKAIQCSTWNSKLINSFLCIVLARPSKFSVSIDYVQMLR